MDLVMAGFVAVATRSAEANQEAEQQRKREDADFERQLRHAKRTGRIDPHLRRAAATRSARWWDPTSCRLQAEIERMERRTQMPASRPTPRARQRRTTRKVRAAAKSAGTTDDDGGADEPPPHAVAAAEVLAAPSATPPHNLDDLTAHQRAGLDLLIDALAERWADELLGSGRGGAA